MEELPINQIICGDALTVMKSWPANSIDMCLTSPPYWKLRDYRIVQIFSDGWKGQLGLEPTIEMYIEHLTMAFNEVKRVLKNTGTLWLNIGDSYGGSGKGFGDKNPDPKFKGGGRERTLMPNRLNKAKCLLMIPERLSLSLIQNGWILRNKISWIKPNCMPSSAKDRLTNKWEPVYLFVKSQKNYFDLDSVREPHTYLWDLERRIKSGHEKYTTQNPGHYGADFNGRSRKQHPKGKNPGDIWIIPTVACPVKGIHFATFPEELCRKAIIPGCPEEVCKKCGKPRERIIKKTDEGFIDRTFRSIHKTGTSWNTNAQGKTTLAKIIKHETIGWTTCDCNAGFEGGIVLDPFCGVGTACYVAQKLRRRFIGIDIKPEYCEKARNVRLAQGVL